MTLLIASILVYDRFYCCVCDFCTGIWFLLSPHVYWPGCVHDTLNRVQVGK